MSGDSLESLKAAAIASLRQEYNQALDGWRTAKDAHGVGSPEELKAAAAVGQKDGALRAAKNPPIS